MLRLIQRWISAPHFVGDEDKTRTAALLNSILLIFIVAASLYGLFAPIDPAMQYRRAIIIVPFVLSMLVLRQLVKRGYIQAMGHLVVFFLWGTFTGAMAFGADYHNPAFMGYLVVVVCAGLILDWRAAIIWSFISIVTNAVVIRLGQIGVLSPSDTATPPFAFWAAQTLYIIISTILLSQTLRKIDEARTNAERELKERKRLESEREKVIKELELKNAELERFTYTVSHDLKSPLITIGGFVGLLEEDARAGNTVKFEKDLERIREAKDKMHRLLNELLELSRIGRILNTPSDFPFYKVVEEALTLTHGRLTEKGVQVKVSPDLPMVNGDYPRLVEVLQNLIDNAAKFTGDQPHPMIEIGVHANNKERVFFVKDNGIGIDKAFHEKIFNLFDKLDPKSDGTGVGLALVKRIIEVHGGKIWVESAGRGQGSIFYFTLPESMKEALEKDKPTSSNQT